MTRLTMALGAALLFLSPALGALSPRAENKMYANYSPHKLVKEEIPPAGKNQGLVVTDQTEIKVDGRPCHYKDVPEGATIILLEVAKDRRTILILHFQTKP